MILNVKIRVKYSLPNNVTFSGNIYDIAGCLEHNNFFDEIFKIDIYDPYIMIENGQLFFNFQINEDYVIEDIQGLESYLEDIKPIELRGQECDNNIFNKFQSNVWLENDNLLSKHLLTIHFYLIMIYFVQ